MSPPKISVVVCTYNRSGLLGNCLQSIIAQTLATSLFEVIIVNNNSTDDTQAVAERFMRDHDMFRVVLEPEQGLSNARNRGWREAVGQYVAFLDDDATASSVWLERILWAFENIRPAPGGVGGQIDLSWEIPRPSWLLDEMLTPLGRLNLSPTPCLLKDEILFGGNLAVPRILLEELGGFDPKLGRGAADLMSNEELLLQHQIRQRGLPLYYDPHALVWHMAPKSRLEKSWFLRRRFWQGVSEIHTEEIKNTISFTQRLEKIWKLCVPTMSCLLKVCLMRNTEERMRLRYRIAFHLGHLRGHCKHLW